MIYGNAVCKSAALGMGARTQIQVVRIKSLISEAGRWVSVNSRTIWSTMMSFSLDKTRQ